MITREQIEREAVKRHGIAIYKPGDPRHDMQAPVAFVAGAEWVLEMIQQAEDDAADEAAAWTIEDIPEGGSFTVRRGGVQWIKGKPQGMNGAVVYCKAKVAKAARPGHGPIHRQRMFYQKTKIYSTDCA